MTKKLRWVLVIGAGVVQLACGESISPPSLARDLDIIVPQLGRAGLETRVTTVAREQPRSPAASFDLTPIDEPSGGEGSGEIPPEWQPAPSILNYWTDAGFGTSSAWGQGFMHYFASHATQTVRLALRYNTNQVANTSATSEESAFLPWFRDLWTSTTVQVGKSCGHSADASTQHSAWHQPPAPLGGLAKWGHQTVPSGKPAAQPPCPPETKKDTVTTTEPANPGGGGGEGGAGGIQWYTCYYYYEYDINTGEILYSAFLGCAGMGGA
jgi:hypothetical protein